MAMSTTEIARLIITVMPDAAVDVQGGEGKYQVKVVSQAFEGLKSLPRQQSINRILREHIQSGAIHAVNMLLLTPEESGLADQTKG